ncbi:hypothetical protein GCK32_000840 [Trichostrongylus colubriformis]|uniref:Uncharacterized protein n=1 Tax=Trichostrongylus colubriformis TaxID=6319 RepID=A0AAN8IUB3_TRICO
MEVFYLNIPWKINEKEYNCSSRDLYEWRRRGAVDIVQGTYFLVVGTIFTSIYMLVMIALMRGKLLSIPCYKLMFFNGFTDILCLILGSHFVAYFQYNGTVFCSNVVLSHIIGHIVWSAWLGSSFGAVVLAFNRLVEMIPSMSAMRFLFTGKFINIWMVICVALMVGRMFITRPTIYNSAVGAFTATPFISDDTQWEVAHYVSVLLPIHNISVIAALVIFYSVICCYVIRISRVANTCIDRVQIQLLVQALVICASTAIAAGLYSVLVFIPVPKYVVVFANAIWQLSQGIPGLVLIFLNRNIREEVKKLFKCEKKINRMFVLSSTVTNK